MLAAMLCALALAACGSGDTGSGPPSEASELAGLIPDNPFGVTEVDLVALREALDLPPDADPSEPPPGDAGERFARTATAAVPICSQSPEPIDRPIARAIDCSMIRAAAAQAGTGIWSITILRTDQPFDEIARSLAERGFERQGRILGHTGNRPVRYQEVVVAEDEQGVIALARDRTQGFAALGEDGLGVEEAVLDALAELPSAPARTARASLEPCVAAFALADLVSDDRGEIVVELEAPAGTDEVPEADAERFQLDSVEGFADRPDAGSLFDFDQPRVDGSTLRASFTLEGTARASGLIAAFDGLSFPRPYDC